MKRSACLPLLLTAVLLCSCGSNAKKAPTRPDQFISEERQFAAPSDGDTIVIFSIVEERQNAVFSIFSTIVTATVPLGAAVILALNQSLGATWSWTLLAFLAVFNIGYTCFWKEETRAVS